VSASRRDWRVGRGAREAIVSGELSGGTWLFWTECMSEEGRDGYKEEEAGVEEEEVIMLELC